MDNSNDIDIDWAALIDLLASEYGWTIDYIKSLDLGQVITIRNTIKRRYDKQNGQESSDDGTLPSSEDSLDVAYFEKLGKKHERKDGTVEIII